MRDDLPPPDDAALLTQDEQHQLWTYLVKGASPQLACRELGLHVRRFWATFDQDPHFVQAIDDLFRTLSHNVLAAVYQQAMKGDKTAQQTWLRILPPSVGSSPVTGATDDDLTTLSDAELLERARTTGVALPDAVAASLSATRGGPTSRRVPGRPANDGE